MTMAQPQREDRVSTRPDHEDPVLRGRTYSIPFDPVWRAAVELAGRGLPRWSVVREDDGPGVIHAEVKPLLWGENSDVLLRIGLDGNGQTRVDMVASSRGKGRDWGVSRRRVVSFFTALDRRLSASPEQIVSPSAGSAAHA